MPRLARSDAPDVLHHIMIRGIEVDDSFLKGKQQIRVKARILFCFWAVCELGFSLTELAGRLGISVPDVGYSV